MAPAAARRAVLAVVAARLLRPSRAAAVRGDPGGRIRAPPAPDGWHIDWHLHACVQNCDVDNPGSCGGKTKTRDEAAYGSLEACCAGGLSWLPFDECVAGASMRESRAKDAAVYSGERDDEQGDSGGDINEDTGDGGNDEGGIWAPAAQLQRRGGTTRGRSDDDDVGFAPDDDDDDDIDFGHDGEGAVGEEMTGTVDFEPRGNYYYRRSSKSSKSSKTSKWRKSSWSSGSRSGRPGWTSSSRDYYDRWGYSKSSKGSKTSKRGKSSSSSSSRSWRPGKSSSSRDWYYDDYYEDDVYYDDGYGLGNDRIVVLRPSDDAFVDRRDPRGNYDRQTLRYDDDGVETLIRFDLSGARRDAFGRGLEAELEAYSLEGCGGYMRVRAVAGTFSERDVTWNNAPDRHGPGGVRARPQREGWLDVDVADTVLWSVNVKGQRYVTFRISLDGWSGNRRGGGRNDWGGADCLLASREYDGGKYSAKLRIRLGGRRRSGKRKPNRKPSKWGNRRSRPLQRLANNGWESSDEPENPPKGMQEQTSGIGQEAVDPWEHVFDVPRQKLDTMEEPQDEQAPSRSFDADEIDGMRLNHNIVRVRSSGISYEGSRFVLRPTDDAYVEARYPETNYNRHKLYYDGNNTDVLIRFDLSRVAGKVQRLSGATLRLYPIAECDGGTRVRVVSGDWSEDGVTWEGAPDHSGPKSAQPDAEYSLAVWGEWFHVDVRRAVMWSVEVKNQGYVTFRISSTSEDGGCVLASREKRMGRFAPRLEVLLGGGSGRGGGRGGGGLKRRPSKKKRQPSNSRPSGLLSRGKPKPDKSSKSERSESSSSIDYLSVKKTKTDGPAHSVGERAEGDNANRSDGIVLRGEGEPCDIGRYILGGRECLQGACYDPDGAVTGIGVCRSIRKFSGHNQPCDASFGRQACTDGCKCRVARSVELRGGSVGTCSPAPKREGSRCQIGWRPDGGRECAGGLVCYDPDGLGPGNGLCTKVKILAGEREPCDAGFGRDACRDPRCECLQADGAEPRGAGTTGVCTQVAFQQTLGLAQFREASREGWFVNYFLGEEGQCVMSCEQSEGPHCHGVATKWDELFSDPEKCCNQKLWWMNRSKCIPGL